MQPDLNNLKSKIQANRDFIDRIAVGIPGFKGYVEKAENYDADRMIRSFITDRILGAKKELGVISGDNARSGDLSAMQDIDLLSKVLEGLLKKVEYADYGASANFSKVKISDEDQNRLLEYDWRLISSFDEVGKSVSALSGMTGEALIAQIKNVIKLVRDYEKSFDDRKYVIMEVI